MATFSRRTFLGTSSLAWMATLLGGSQLDTLLGNAPGAVPDLATLQSTRTGHALRAQVPLGSAFPLPYLMQGSCELSQDWFSTTAVVIGDGDQVVPYRASDGSVGAFVNTAGTVNRLVRDATQPSGWNYTQVPYLEPSSSNFVIAVVTDTTGSPQMVMANDNGGGQWEINSYQWPADTTIPNEIAAEVPGGCVPSMLQANLTRAGAYYFAWLETDSSTGAQKVVVWQPAVDGSGGRATRVCALPATPAVQDLMVMHADSSDDAAGSIYWLSDASGTGDGQIMWAAQQADGSYEPQGPVPDTGGVGFEALLAAGWPTSGSAPWLLAQDTSHMVRSIQLDNDLVAAIGPFSGPLAPGAAAAWFQGGMMALAFTDQGTASTSTEYFDANTGGGFTNPIPLSTGVQQVLNLTSDPLEGTLFAVATDLSLSVWTKDPVSGWAQTPIMNSSPQTLMINCWRAELTVYDANQNPVAACDVQIVADRDVGIWQPAGHTIARTGQPVTMTTDVTGRVTFSIPATDLDTAQLTVQAYPNGAASGDPFTVTIDIDAHNYLAGTAGLTDLPTPLTGQSMLDATDSSGQPLFTALTGLSGDDQTNGANAAAAAVNHMVNAGLGATPSGNDPQSVMFDMSNPVPTWTTSPVSGGAVAAVGSIWSDAAHDIESACRGIRNGVVHVVKSAANWVKDEADDAFHWAVALYVDVDRDIDNTVNLVIKDMRTAIHAVSGFFQTLGADIVKGIEWLVHNVFELLEEVGKNAATIRSWLTEALAHIGAAVTDAKTDIDGWLTSVKNDADGAIARLQANFGPTNSLGSSAQRSGPTSYTGSHIDEALDVIGKINSFLNHITGRFLLDKLLHHVDAAHQPALDPNLEALLEAVSTDFRNVESDVANFAGQLFSGFQDLLGSKASFDEATISDVLGVLGNLVDDGLDIVDAIVDAVFAVLEYAVAQLGAVLDYSVQMVPLIGDLLEVCGVNSTLTAAEVVSLVVAFPATVLAKVSGVGPLFPTEGASAAAADPWLTSNLIVTCVTQAIWGVNDLIIDAKSASTQQTGGVPDSSIPVIIDILCPVVEWVAGWPGAPNPDGTTAAPFTNPVATGGAGDKLLPSIMWLGTVDPFMAALGHIIGPSYDPTQPVGTFRTYAAPVINALASVALTVLTGLYNWESGAPDPVKAASILGNLSNILSPFATKWMSDPTDGGSVLVKFCVDGAANLGAAICDFDSALTPAGS